MVLFFDVMVFDDNGNCIVRVSDTSYHIIPENFLWNEVKLQIEKSPYGPIFTDVIPGNTKIKLSMKECEHPDKKIMWTNQLSPVSHTIVATAALKDKDDKIRNELFKMVKNLQKMKGQVSLTNYEPVFLKICNKPANSNVQLGHVQF